MPEGGWTQASVPYLSPRAAGQADAWTAEAAARGRKGTQRVVLAGEVRASGEVADLLGLDEAAEVIVRQRVILLDGEATELTDTYYPADLARGTRLAETSKIPGGAVTLLAELGYVAHAVREVVRARMPDVREQELLATGPGAPVLTLTRVTADARGVPFQVDVSVFPATAHGLSYEMRVG
ncbi:GntR family transcriptional regulator [Streptomyces sp. NPDC002454]|uniref:GntR family transcriptional regulator n=1 Tax=Streptomyces sp. NPDC002490 TaxID=3154416 RepID=UPI00333203CD